jgi:hypothetical protein
VYAVVKIYHEQGDIENRPRSGRKKKLDDRDNRKLLRLVKNNRSLPLQDITRKFNENRNYIKTKADLGRVVTEVWTSLPLHYIQSLYQSLPKRIKAVIRSVILLKDPCALFPKLLATTGHK